jgi:hypothetical protein
VDGHLGAVEVIGNLDQDSRAVAHQWIGTDGATMVEVLENLQALLDDRMRSAAFDVGNETDPAGVVFKARVVEAMRNGAVIRERWDGGGLGLCRQAHDRLRKGWSGVAYCGAALTTSAIFWGQIR